MAEGQSASFFVLPARLPSLPHLSMLPSLFPVPTFLHAASQNTNQMFEAET